MQKHSNVRVLRRRRDAAVIVCSYHEILGALFWATFNEGSVERYALSADIERAHRFDSDELDVEGLLSNAFDCGANLDGLIYLVPPSERDAISSAALTRWVASTTWFEISASRTSPPNMRSRSTRSLDGRAYRSIKAIRDFSCGHCHESLAAPRVNAFVCIRANRKSGFAAGTWTPETKQPARAECWVNHRLEADAAWSEWQLSLRFGLTDVNARHRALKHASMTGWNSAGGTDPADEPCFEQSADLRAAFEQGRALYRAINFQQQLECFRRMSDDSTGREYPSGIERVCGASA